MPTIYSYILYFTFAFISILGIGLTGHYLSKKLNRAKPFEFPDQQKDKWWYIIAIFTLFWVLAFGVELLGHMIGIWTWNDVLFIPPHAIIWWGTSLTVALFKLSSLDRIHRYLIFLGWVLLFEFLQETFVHLVSHNPLIFGTPYVTITIVMSIVSMTQLIALKLVKKLKWLK